MGLKNYLFCKDTSDKLNSDIGRLEEQILDREILGEIETVLVKHYAAKKTAQSTIPNLVHLIGLPACALTGNIEHYPVIAGFAESWRFMCYIQSKQIRNFLVPSLIVLGHSKKSYNDLMKQLKDYRNRPFTSPFSSDDKNDGYDGWMEPPKWNQ